MAGAGYKLFNTGDVLTAAQVNTYLQEQTVMVFASSTARTTALSGVLAEGMMSYLQDTNAVEVYNGTSWVNVGNAGDLTEIVAGTGITVTSGTGPIPTVALTTPVAATDGGTAQTTYTTGDLLYASGTNTLAKRAIGSTGNVLTVSGGVPTWAAPAGGSTFSGVAARHTDQVQTIANNTTTALVFGTEYFDTDAYHSTTTNNTRFTVPSGKAGYYSLVCNFEWATNGTGQRTINYRINGTTKVATLSVPAVTGAFGMCLAFTTSSLSVGDYVEVTVNQTSGGNLDIYSFADGQRFAMTYLGA